MEYNQLELQRETIFKDAVIAGAEQRAANIVERAQKDSERAIQEAMLTCEEADHDTVQAHHALQTARQVGALSHSARREILAWRAALVDGLFEEIAGELADFAASEAYAGWLAKRLEKHAGFIKAAKAPVVYLRSEDMPLAKGLEKAAPGARFAQGATFRLGGCKIGDGKRLLDETLDAALEEEKQRFFAESGLSL